MKSVAEIMNEQADKSLGDLLRELGEEEFWGRCSHGESLAPWRRCTEGECEVREDDADA